MKTDFRLDSLKNNYWSPSLVGSDYKKVPKDEWWIEREFPYKINQCYDEVLKDDIVKEMYSIPGNAWMSSMITAQARMSLNSMYGAYGASNGGISSNHMSTLTSMYYRSDRAEEKQIVYYKELETAECFQKQLLTSHYKHKLTKLSKKKKDEVKTLTTIINVFKEEIELYMDEYPERFI